MSDLLPRPISNRRQFSYWLLPAAVFLLLATATLAAWHWQSRLQAAARELANNQESAAITAEIRDRLRLHAQFLRSLQAFATANPSLDLNAWQRYALQIDITDNLAGLFAFAYAPAIIPADRERFVFATRLQVDRSNFRIFPKTRGEIVAPVSFIAPQTPELQSAIGFDLLSERIRRQAIETATATGDIAMTGPITLVTDQVRRPAFLMVHALYRTGLPLGNARQRRHAFGGVVLTSYHTDNFFSSLQHGAQSSFALRVFDESLAGSHADSPSPTLIYDSDPEPKELSEAASLHHEIDFGGRNWILEFRQRSNQSASQALDLPTVILIGGLSGTTLIALLVFHLSTHRKRAERYAQELTRELRQNRDHLHELVAERTARLDTALHQALAANQAKTEFLANMSHELRTPMHAVLGFSQLGVDRAQTEGQTRMGQYFQRIEQSASRLLGLINELLDLSKMEAGHMALTPVRTDMLDLLQQAGAQLESLLLARQLQIEIVTLTPDVELSIDPERITQVICNLLSNAIKFSPDGGTIRVEMATAELPLGRRAKDNAVQLALAVRFIDHGIGIPADELESIFDKFEQSSASRTGAGGTGLGLAISRAIVRQHRGTIVAENNVGGGACFTVTLPINNGTGIAIK